MDFPNDFQNSLKNQFLNLLSRLSSSETKDYAIKEIYSLITKNSSPKNIRIWLSSLLDYKRPPNKLNNDYEVLLIGFLATVYKSDFIDPIEKPPHITKTILKLIMLLQNYFRDSDEKIPAACSKTWREIYVNCLFDQTLEIRSLLMFDTLFGIIVGGTDRLSQHTSLLILRDFIECLGNLDDREFIHLISLKMFPVFLKNVFDVPIIIQIATLLVGYLNWEDFNQFNKEIIDRTIFYLNNQKPPFNNYIYKMECLNFFKILAIKSIETNEYTIGVYYDQIVKSILESTKDRVIKVQTAAKEALNYWKRTIQRFQQLENAKTSQAFKMLGADDLINIRSSNDFYPKNGDENNNNNQAKMQNYFNNRNENMSENNRRINNNESNYDQLFQKNSGWIAETKGKNYIKKKTGTGGGFIIWDQQQDPKRKEIRTSNENLKKELNEILTKNRDFENPPPKKQNNFEEMFVLDNFKPLQPKTENPNLDDTIKYDSDAENNNLDDTLDFNEPVDKKPKYDDLMEKEEGISKIWLKTLDHLENNELEEAYSTVLESGDDIYLIRLMMKTGSCLKKLRRKTAVLLLKRLALIGKSNFLQKMCLNFLDDFKNKDATEALKIEDQKKILEALKNIQRKNGTLQQQSTQLHEYFSKKFK